MTIATNLLVNFGLSLVASFASVLSLPDEDVPRSSNDLQKIIVMPAGTALGMVSRNGTLYHIQDGVVRLYDCASFVEVPAVGNTVGMPLLTTNQAIDIASASIRKLIKTGPGPERCSIRKSNSRGFLNCYQIQFFQTNKAEVAAQVELDEKSGRIMRLSVDAICFLDPERELAAAKEITGFDPDADPFFENEYPPQPLELPRPSTNYVAIVLRNLHAIEEKANFDPHPSPSLADVDWSRTFLTIDRRLSDDLICELEFKNGPFVMAAFGAVFFITEADAIYIGPHRMKGCFALRRFFGPANQNWRTLADRIEDFIVNGMGFPRAYVTNLQLEPPWLPPLPLFAGKTLQRVDIHWRRPAGQWEQGEPPRIRAELNLVTGRTKALCLYDPELIRTSARTQEVVRDEFPCVNVVSGPERGVFAFNRDGHIHEATRIAYTVSSALSASSDIRLTNFISIPPEILYTNIVIRSTELERLGRGSAGSVALTILPSKGATRDLPSYVIGSYKCATNTVADKE